jgi:hypothetical protein
MVTFPAEGHQLASRAEATVTVECGGCGTKVYPDSNGEPLQPLPHGWHYLVAVPPLPVCSAECAAVVKKRRPNLTLVPGNRPK